MRWIFVNVERTRGFRRLIGEVSAAGIPGALFFFQAEDGIRDVAVTGVQTCALPIFTGNAARLAAAKAKEILFEVAAPMLGVKPHQLEVGDYKIRVKIGRASCRERV